MKPRIGAEITRPTMRRILDMREPLVPALSLRKPPPAPRSPAITAPPQSAASQRVPWYRRELSWRALFVRSLKLGVLLGLAIVFLSLRVDLAERLIAIYATASFLYRIDSQRTFLVALILIILAGAWAISGQIDRTQLFAVYAFYFLAIGLFNIFREMLRY